LHSIPIPLEGGRPGRRFFARYLLTKLEKFEWRDQFRLLRQTFNRTDQDRLSGKISDHLLMSLLLRLRNIFRRIALALLPALLILIALSILAVQFKEVSTRNEFLSLSSFIVLISFSALAFNWCRTSPSLSSERTLKIVFQTGIDLFLASLLALVATFFAWLQTISSLPAFFYPLLFAVHWLFLLFSVSLFLISMLFLLRAVSWESATGPDETAHHKADVEKP
jgi:hypothetical protein